MTRGTVCNKEKISLLTTHLGDRQSASLGRGDNTRRSVDAVVLDEILLQEAPCHDSISTPAVTQANVQEHKYETLVDECSSGSAPDEIQTSRLESEYVSNSAQTDVEAQKEELQNSAAMCMATMAAEKRTMIMDDAVLCTNSQVKKIDDIGLNTILEVGEGRCEYCQNHDDPPPPPSPLSRLLRDCDDLLSYGPDPNTFYSEEIDASSDIPCGADCQPLQSREDKSCVSHPDVNAGYVGSSVVESECKTMLTVPPLSVECLDYHNLGTLPREPESSHYYIPQTGQDLDALNDKTDFEDISGNWHNWEDDLSYTSGYVDREMGGHFGNADSGLRPASSVAQSYTLEDKTKTMSFATYQVGNTNFLNYTEQLCRSEELSFSWKPYWRI